MPAAREGILEVGLGSLRLGLELVGPRLERYRALIQSTYHRTLRHALEGAN